MTNKRVPTTGPNTRSQPIENARTTILPTTGAVKNAEDAKSHLTTTGWVAPGESFAMETLARVLFATVANIPKIPPAATTVLTSVAYILTEEMETGTVASVADKISAHIKDTIDTLTTNLHDRLDQQVKAVSETAQSQATLTESLLKAQEKLDETTQNVLKKTYSQAAAAAAVTPTFTQTPTPPISADQIRIRNKEEIKRRQVLIEFSRDQDLQLENMTADILGRKAKDAINTVWAAAPNPKPEIPRIKTVVLLRNGGLLLELDREESAGWLRNEENRKSVLENIGSGASIKDRSYQVIVQFIPVHFDTDDDEMYRRFEEANDLQPGSVLKAEWIKPIKDRRENQRVATARFYLKDAKSANSILSKGAYVFGRKVVPKKPRREPIRCLNCQLFGHERRHCVSNGPRCARCAMGHATEDCRAQLRSFTCRNCEGRHASFDRECPKFIEKCAQLDMRCPENNLAFYPTDEPWSWATKATNYIQEPRHDDRPDARYRDWGDNFRSGTNTVPIGPPHPLRMQPDHDIPQ